jgi:hypothetical protein
MDCVEAPASSMSPLAQFEETIRYSKEEWDAQRPVVEGMYHLKGITLEAIVATLKENGGLVVT